MKSIILEILKRYINLKMPMQVNIFISTLGIIELMQLVTIYLFLSSNEILRLFSRSARILAT